MPRSPKTALNILLVHCQDAHTIAEVAYASHHHVRSAADYEEALALLGHQRVDLLIAPLQPDVAALLERARRYGVPLWLVAEAHELNAPDLEPGPNDEFLQRPVVEIVLRQRLRIYLERREFRKRQTHLENLLRENASLDPLTNMPNRHFALQNMRLQWQRYRRKGMVFCCILCDLDDFKKYNDAYGQSFGDNVLKTVAQLLKAHVRGADVVCRYEGQEFCVVCSHAELAGAVQLAQRLRARLADLELAHEVSISASFAVVQSEPRFRSPDQMLRAAEETLARAKSAGFNQLLALETQVP